MSLQPGGNTNSANGDRRRRLRLKPLKPQDLPQHPSLAALQSGRSNNVDLRNFVQEVLTEAVEFADRVVPSNFQKKGGSKPSPPSNAKVKVLSSSLMQDEHWFARQSIHENAPIDGTASFDEFEAGIFDNHSVNEASYTPSVYDAHKVLDWSEQITELQGDFGVEFEEVVVEIYEMCHNIPTPLNNRVFCTLVVRGFTRPGSFVVAQIPVDLRKVPNAIYTNGKNKREGSDAQKRAKVVVGQYTSVERCVELDDGNIMWEMATASDAKGWLPMAMQKLGIPGAIVKDVGFFMQWVADRRKTQASGHGKVGMAAEPETSNGAQDEGPDVMAQQSTGGYGTEPKSNEHYPAESPLEHPTEKQIPDGVATQPGVTGISTEA